MICPKCNKEFSPKVWKIHVSKCGAQPEENKEEIELKELRKLAKEQGIERYWLKSVATLKDELLKGGYDDAEGS